jgi:hypothetical protein
MVNSESNGKVALVTGANKGVQAFKFVYCPIEDYFPRHRD